MPSKRRNRPNQKYILQNANYIISIIVRLHIFIFVGNPPRSCVLNTCITNRFYHHSYIRPTHSVLINYLPYDHSWGGCENHQPVILWYNNQVIVHPTSNMVHKNPPTKYPPPTESRVLWKTLETQKNPYF